MKKTNPLAHGTSRKLGLHRETLRRLAEAHLDSVHGGVAPGKVPPPPTGTCPPDLPTK